MKQVCHWCLRILKEKQKVYVYKLVSDSYIFCNSGCLSAELLFRDLYGEERRKNGTKKKPST